MAAAGDVFPPSGAGGSQPPTPLSALKPGAEAKEVGYQQSYRSVKSKKGNNYIPAKHRTYMNELNFFNSVNNYERFLYYKSYRWNTYDYH